MAEPAALPAQAAVAAILARPAVASVMACLDTDGEEARLVGGAVRNALLGLPVSDIDIATTALPAAVIARATAAGAHVVPTGIAHGTVTVIVGGVPCEVTTLREDIDTDGRRAKVRFGRDFRADALRRDFTINALSASRDGAIHDYADGLADLAARRIRFIGDADQRIREDYLRILRFFRFAATYGEGRLDPSGLAAVLRHGGGIARLSRERIRAEMMKLLAAAHALPVLGAMAAGGILAEVLGGPADLARLARLTDIETAHSVPSAPLRRLMALALLPDAEVIAMLRERLRLTNREIARMEAVAPHIAPPLDAPVLLYRLGPEALRDVALLHAAETGEDITAALSIADKAPPAFLLSGKDVLALGIASGPAVARILNAAESLWLAANMPGEAEQRAILEEVARQPDPNATP